MLRRAADLVLIRYLFASVLALGVDVGTFVALLHGGFAPTAAATAGYSLGIVGHWLLSSRAVFTEGVAQRGPQRTRQKALFVLSALAGLGVTTLIVAAAGPLHIDPRLAKMVAIGVSFTLTWLLRRAVIFRVVETS